MNIKIVDDSVLDQLVEMGADSRFAKNLDRELRQGFRLYKEREKARMMNAAAEAQDIKKIMGKGGIFKPVTTMSQEDFLRLNQKYGHEEVHSRQFQRYLHKKMPELKIANV